MCGEQTNQPVSQKHPIGNSSAASPVIARLQRARRHWGWCGGAEPLRSTQGLCVCVTRVGDWQTLSCSTSAEGGAAGGKAHVCSCRAGAAAGFGGEPEGLALRWGAEVRPGEDGDEEAQNEGFNAAFFLVILKETRIASCRRAHACAAPQPLPSSPLPAHPACLSARPAGRSRAAAAAAPAGNWGSFQGCFGRGLQMPACFGKGPGEQGPRKGQAAGRGLPSTRGRGSGPRATRSSLGTATFARPWLWSFTFM